MERPTKEIITPKGKHKILIVEWITGREGREIDSPMMDIKVSIQGKGINDLNLGEVTRLSKEIAIKIVIISIDNDSKNIIDRILDMPKPEYEFVMGEIDKVIGGVDFMKPVLNQKDGTD